MEGRKDNDSSIIILHEQYGRDQDPYIHHWISNEQTFLTSQEKFLGYATTKFGNDVTFALNKRRVELMHTKVPQSIDYSATSLYKQRQHEIEAKEYRAEFRKLKNDLGKLNGVLWDQYDSGMKNKIQSDVDCRCCSGKPL